LLVWPKNCFRLFRYHYQLLHEEEDAFAFGVALCFAVETLTQMGEEEEGEDRGIQETRLPSLRCRSLHRWPSQWFAIVVADVADVVDISAEVEEAEEEEGEAIEVPPLAELGTLHLLPSSSCSRRPVVDFC